MDNISLPRSALKSEVEALDKVAHGLSTLPEVERAVLFGSRSRGDFEGLSDFDLLVIVSDIRIKDRVIGILHDIELKYDMPISPVIFTSKEYGMNKRLKSGFVENIEKEGIVLYVSEHKG